MLDEADRSAFASELLAACDAAAFVPLLTARQAGFTMADAAAVADAARSLRLARGERPLGYKIGFTNRSIWPLYGVHEPIWGPVWDTTTHLLPGTQASTSLAGLSLPRLEPEIAFGFRSAPRAGMDEAELTACLDWVAHSFEIVHTHFENWKFQAPDCFADFALHGRLFIGPRVPVARFERLGRELAALRVELCCGERIVDRGVGSNVLDGPLNALRLWVDAMAAQANPWPIRPGDVVTTGTITDAQPLAPGEVWHSRLSDPRLSALTLSTEA